MTTRPIALRPWQVRAALDGRLRRIVAPLKVQPPDDWRPAPGLVEIHRCDEWGEPMEPRTKRDVLGMGFTEADGLCGFVMPYAPGDTLYGREVWAHVPRTAYAMSDGVQQRLDATDPDMAAVYKAGWERCAPRWRSPVTMPKWASRWTLTVGEVALIRAQDVTETAAAECGFKAVPGKTWWQGYRDLGRNGALLHQTFPGDEPPAWMIEPKILMRAENDILAQPAARLLSYQFTTDHGPDAWDRNDWCVSASVEVRKGNVDE